MGGLEAALMGMEVGVMKKMKDKQEKMKEDDCHLRGCSSESVPRNGPKSKSHGIRIISRRCT